MSTTVLSTTPVGDVSEPQPHLLRRAWEGWKRFAHAFGVFQTRLVMSLLYFIIVLPVGIVVRLASDPLQLREPDKSNWVPVPKRPHSIDTAHQQF